MYKTQPIICYILPVLSPWVCLDCKQQRVISSARADIIMAYIFFQYCAMAQARACSHGFQDELCENIFWMSYWAQNVSQIHVEFSIVLYEGHATSLRNYANIQRPHSPLTSYLCPQSAISLSYKIVAEQTFAPLLRITSQHTVAVLASTPFKS